MTNTARKIANFEKLVEVRNPGIREGSIFWFIARANLLKGPFTPEELNQKLKAGEVTRFDYGWRQGFQEWRPLGSLEEFKTEENIYFGSYPSLPVPGQSSGSARERFDETSSSKKRKDVEVRLRTTTRHFFNPRQSTVAVLFAILVSFVTVQWFHNQVHHKISTFFQSRTAGLTLTMGESVESAPPPEAWTPLYSAPGYQEIKAHLKLPVKTYGIPQYHSENLQLGLQKIDVPSGSYEDALSFSELDPVYHRPVEVRGHLNPHSPVRLRVKHLGDPFQESFWEK